ncbi:MAG: DUF3810 domain-containing protein, partial [Clostridia bacterium]|nr:DUF3810 domain-containing protein [Clostridia bacterium]
LTEKIRELPVYAEGQASLMPWDYQGMNDALVRAYDILAERYPFVSSLQVGTKPVYFSSLMSYTKITGVYMCLTGEANVNTSYPDYSTVFTAAHEMAHQRGIARENEANFVAFLACTESEEPYLRYAGYLNMLQYVSNALYQTDKNKSMEIWNVCDPSVFWEYAAYNDVFDAYDKGPAGDIAEAVNDTYLQVMGTGGTVEYGLVVNLAVSYYQNQIR